MSSITIHNIDTSLDQRLTAEAKKNKTSKNRLVKDILAHSFGIPIDGVYADDYREFCGVWTVSEREAFDAFQDDNAVIDAGDWRS